MREGFAAIKLRAAVLEVLVRLAQSMGFFPQGVLCAVPGSDVMTRVDGGSFGNIYRSTGSGRRLALKEPHHLEGGRETPVHLSAAPIRAAYSL